MQSHKTEYNYKYWIFFQIWYDLCESVIVILLSGHFPRTDRQRCDPAAAGLDMALFSISHHPVQPPSQMQLLGIFIFYYDFHHYCVTHHISSLRFNLSTYLQPFYRASFETWKYSENIYSHIEV